MAKKTEMVHFRVHTMNLLHEIADCGLGRQNGIFFVPLNTLRQLLAQAAQRATELNDPVLNRIMFDLTLYELPKPSDPAYLKLMRKLYREEKQYLKKKKSHGSPAIN